MEITEQEYIDALSNISLSTLQTRILQTFRDMPDHAATAPQVGEAIDRQFGAINLHFGSLGRKVAEYLHRQDEVPISKTRKAPRWYECLAEGYVIEDDFYWVLRPNLVQALEKLSWLEGLHGT